MNQELRTVLVPLPPVQWGGLQTFAANLNASLRNAGWRWLVVVPPEAKSVLERFAALNVDVIESPLPRLRRSLPLSLRSLWKFPAQLSRLAARLKSQNISVVQAVGAHHFHGVKLASEMNRPLVWQIHSTILPAPIRRLVAPIIASKSDAIMTNGRQVAKAFWGRETVNSSHFHFYAPVDSGKFAPDSCRREATRRRLGFGPDHVVIGTVGNRVWQKNHAFLVKAASRLKDLYPKLRFLIIGEPSGSYLKEYSRSVETPAIELNREYPNFVQFASPGCEVNDWLQALDVFVLVSHAEGVPIALFEAMSAAKAVVSARVGSIEEIVEENVTGFLYERDDLQVFLSRITELSLDQARRERMGEAGRNVILEKFSLNQVVTAHVRAYGTAIKNYERSK